MRVRVISRGRVEGGGGGYGGSNGSLNGGMRPSPTITRRAVAAAAAAAAANADTDTLGGTVGPHAERPVCAATKHQGRVARAGWAQRNGCARPRHLELVTYGHRRRLASLARLKPQNQLLDVLPHIHARRGRRGSSGGRGTRRCSEEPTGTSARAGRVRRWFRPRSRTCLCCPPRPCRPSRPGRSR